MKQIFIVLLSISFMGNIQSQSLLELDDQAEKCFEKGDYKCAIKIYKKLVKKDKKYRAIHYLNLGTAQRRIGELSKALKSYNKAIKLNSKSVLYYNNRGTLKQKMRDFNGAIKDFNKALELDGKSKTALVNRGMLLHLELKKYKEGRADLETFLVFEPNDFEVESNLVYLFKKEGDLEKAIEGYNKLIKKYPNNARLYNSRADTYVLLKRFEEAIADANKSIEIIADNSLAIATKGEAYLGLGKLEEACEQFNLALELGLNKNMLNPLLEKCK